METSSGIRVVIGIGVAILAVFILVQVGRLIFSDESEVRDVSTQVPLVDFAATDAVAGIVIDGKINGNEQHRAIRIDVSRTSRDIEIVKGYQNTVIRRQTFDNNQPAFASFLRALDLEGFTKTNPRAESDDPRGACPFGSRTIMTLTSEGESIQRLWDTDCARIEGTSAGKRSSIEKLFQLQIPNYRNYTRNVDL